MGDHNSTSDWYTVNPKTAVGTDMLENKIDLKSKPTAQNKKSNSQFNINDYVGMWYESKDLEGYSDVCIDLDENGKILVEFGIYRLTTFDELNVTLNDNVITFTDEYGTNGTITLENGKVILVYSTNAWGTGIDKQKVEFNYKKQRKSTEILSGFDISGNWETGTDEAYKGELKLNTNNTYNLSITSNENGEIISSSGNYKIYGNKVYFTTSSGKGGTAEMISASLAYKLDNGVTVKFYPE